MATRRWGTDGAETRSALLDAAELLMRAGGYAAVTSRQLGRAAGLSPQIVYYYFKTMDDLFIALFSRLAEYYLDAIEEARNADEPLLAMWELSCDRSRAVIIAELMAMANHRKGLQSFIAKFGRKYHAKQTEIIEAEIKAKGLDMDGCPPAVLAAMFETMARGFAAGHGYDIAGHSGAQRFITQRLKELAQKPKDSQPDFARAR